ncbi:hypothetical protein F4818DRAFT_405055 [Hypoxylon cercidicola]|nr:hypothetical protein F4818DRAFT_405055 [Hypoxylon cercidicola]
MSPPEMIGNAASPETFALRKMRVLCSEQVRISQTVLEQLNISVLTKVFLSIEDGYYLAGCTDPAFRSDQCPDKGFYDVQQYVPLKNCDDDWSGCYSYKDAPGDEITDPPCECDAEDALFHNPPTLDMIALLPTKLGGSISWYPGMKPTVSSTKPKAISTSTPMPVSTQISSNTLTTTAISTPASTLSSDSPVAPLPTTTTSPDGTPVISDPGSPEPSTTSGPAPSTAMYVGVGVGVSVGAILIGCLLYLALLLRKRKSMRQGDSDNDPMAYLGQRQPTLPVLPPTPPRDDDYPIGTAFSSFRPELAAGGLTKAGTSVITTSSDPNSPVLSSAPQSPPQRQYQAYNPLVHGNYAERRESARSASETAASVSSASPNSQEHGQQGNQGFAPSTQIHELAG